MPQHCPADRRAILDRWRRSGLPATDYAITCGLSSSTLYRWRRAERDRPLGFVELVVPAGDSPAETPWAPAGDSGVVIELRDGVAIRLASGFDGAALRRAIESIR